jgi:hypothetical protein
MASKPKRQVGQALTEFLFVLPILLLILFSAIQIFGITECQQKAQMATWFAMRSQAYDSGHRRVSKSAVEDSVQRDMFGSNDRVRVTLKSSGLVFFWESVSANVECSTPYLFRRSRWQALQDVFGDVVDDGRITVSSENWMRK